MKILFFGKRFYTNRDTLGERYGRIFNLPKHWARQGHVVSLDLIDYHSWRHRKERVEGVRVRSLPIRSLRILGAMTSWFFRRKSYDVVVASGDCYIGLLGFLVALIHRVPFIFDIYDKYDEFPGYFSVPGLDLFEALIRRADACTFASEALRNTVGREAKEAVWVPNAIDPEHFETPSTKAFARNRYSLPLDKNLVGYFGSLDEARGISDLVEAVRLINSRGGDLHCLVAGPASPNFPEDSPPWLHYVGDLPYTAVPTAMAACDLLALPYRESDYLNMASSCKIAEYLACRKPLVATATPNLMENFPSVSEILYGRLAEPGNPTDLARVIDLQMESPVVAPCPRENTWEAASERALEILVKLTSP